MTEQRQAIQDRLEKLQEAIAAFSGGNRGVLFDSRDLMLDFTESVATSRWTHATPICELIQELLGYLLRYGNIGEEQGILFAGKLIEYVDETLKRPPVGTIVRDSSEDEPAVDYAAAEIEELDVVHDENGEPPSLDSLINESRLGNILLARDQITPDQLDQALGLQQINRGRLGDILVQMGAIDEPTLHHALVEQRRATLRLTSGISGEEKKSAIQKREPLHPDSPTREQPGLRMSDNRYWEQ